MRIRAVSTVTPVYPRTVPDLPDIATDSTLAAAPPEPAAGFRSAVVRAGYEEAGIGPEGLDLAEVHDLSTALELDWYEDLGLCPPGGAEAAARRGHAARGRIPVAPSGGLSSFGEAVPAQALAQVCEPTWQVARPVGAPAGRGARVGVTANQGLFGHGSSVVVIR
ncbi:thiolase C-terminal domain-containing protein [Actinacidiphila glaucinigra]|uniref:thiolase C-terminal domain-containing protein n=1 Tax=Actinacidiphila glaucinigra TaxID=235986 RepID=UPI0037FC932D